MKILRVNEAVSKQAEDSRRQQQAERSREQLKDAGAKFSSALKEPKAEKGLSKDNRNKLGDSRRQQQAKQPKAQLEDAGTTFSSALKEPKTEEMLSKAGLDKRKDDSPFDRSVDSTGAGRGEGVIANSGIPRTETLAVAKGTQEAPVAHDINSVAQQIAARVLVSPPGTTNPEVRIQLKESILEGSDVRIFREGGALKIVFVAPSQEAANFIATNRDAMAATLSDRLPGERIDISIATRQSEHERGEHGEGRSRQQYVADDDADAP